MVPGHDATEEPRDDARGPSHEPVMLARIVELLAPALRDPGSVLVDGTLGLGGHSEAVLAACPGARVVGIDRDTEALARAGARLAPYGERFTGVHATYDELPGVLADLGLDPVGGVMGVLLDLGVSSMQLDVLDRGFAYRADAPLDMRMDGRGEGPTAADVLNTYSAADLALVLSTYGEERFARRIADAVVVARASAPFSTSARLVELLYDVIPAPARRTGGHPAKRTFQALRMEVNDELGGLERVLPAALDAVAVGGRVVVEAYHSLEDRLVKRAFAEVTRSVAPPDLPVVPPELQPAVVAVTRGAEQADDAEREHNPRAASVRLRAVERVRPASATARPHRATRSTRSARQRPARSRPASGGHR